MIFLNLLIYNYYIINFDLNNICFKLIGEIQMKKSFIISLLILSHGYVSAQQNISDKKPMESFIVNNGNSPKQINITQQEVPINTPLATDGANYDGAVETGLEEYRKKQKLLNDKVEAIKIKRQQILEEYQRQKEYEAYLKAVKEAQEKVAKQNAQANTKVSSVPKEKTITAQEYFDRQTKIMQGQE